jgi:MFS family permease
MDTPVQAGATSPPAVPPVPTSPASPPAGPPVSATVEAEVTPFNVPLAIRYSVANLGSQAVFALFNFGMPLYLETYGLPPPLIGLLANERSFVGAFVQPIVGRLSDRTRTPLGRRRPFFLAGIPLMAVALGLLAFHPPFGIRLSLVTIGAFFLFVAADPWYALRADLFPPDQRGRVGGIIGLTTAIGIIVFNLVATFLWKDYEPLVFAITISFLLATWGFTFLTVKEPPVPPHVEAPRAARPNLRAYIESIRAYPEAAKFMLGTALFWVGSGGAAPFITLFGKNALHADTNLLFFLPLSYVVAQVIFCVPAGVLADRLGKKRMLIAGLLIFGVGALVGSQSVDLVQATLALGVVGLGAACLSVINPLLTDLVPRARTAEFIGLGSALWSFAQPVGSVLAGGLVALMGSESGHPDAYRWAFVFAGAMGLVAAFCMRWVRPERAVLD